MATLFRVIIYLFALIGMIGGGIVILLMLWLRSVTGGPALGEKEIQELANSAGHQVIVQLYDYKQSHGQFPTNLSDAKTNPPEQHKYCKLNWSYYSTAPNSFSLTIRTNKMESISTGTGMTGWEYNDGSF